MLDTCGDLLTVKELQNILHIGRSKAYQLISAGAIYSIRIGKTILIPKRDLIEYIDRLCYNTCAVDGYSQAKTEVLNC